MREKTLVVVTTISQPWPPSGMVMFGQEQEGEDSVAVLADETGRLLIRRIVDGHFFLDAFQPLEVEGEPGAIIHAHWTPSETAIVINGTRLSPDDIGAAPHVLRQTSATSLASEPLFANLDPATVSGEAERFFVETLRDIEIKLLTRERYHIIRSAGLLRQLVIDGGQSLVAIVNRKYRLRLTFEVLDSQAPLPVVPDLDVQNLDPAPFPGAQTTIVSLDDLLRTPCISFQGSQATVRDVIRACANAMGGVHLGNAESASEQVVLDIDKVLQSAQTAGLEALVGICRVVLRGLVPLARATGAAQQSVAADGASPRS